MKKIFIILMLVSFAQQGWTQETHRNQFSSAPDTARYEIFQSELGVMITLLIDKYTGKGYQLVVGKTGLTWQLLDCEKHILDKATPGRVNYQVFTSGEGIRFTFLLNVNTGATWQLAKDKDSGKLFWAAFD